MKKSSLFSHLFSSFIVVMLIPLGAFFFYLSIGNKALERSLEQQVNLAVEQDNITLSSVLDSYRHKAYQLSTDPITVKMLQEGKEEENRQMYNLMFNTMKGDTYLASAHIVSKDGKIRLSTHSFPDVYDLRFHTNASEAGSLLSLVSSSNLTASTISIMGRQMTERGNQIVATVVRQVYDKGGRVLGYVIVEIFSNALSGRINKDSLLSEEVLIDPSSFYASSIIHANQSGSFGIFPDLATLDNLDVGVHSLSHKVLAIGNFSGTPLLLAGSISSSPYSTNMKQSILIMLITLCVGTLFSCLCAFLFSRSISRPVKELAETMKSVEKGNLKAKAKEANILEIDKLDHSFNTMVSRITSLMAITREEEMKLAEAERKALESQMNPHFLFNTLNTIKALAKLHGEKEISIIALKLGKLLRSTVDNHESECTVEESMSLVESYLTIQSLRFGEKLHVSLLCPPECRDIMTPKLIIQPMVENAIVHGLEPKAGEWNLTVTLAEKEGSLTIIVRDDGVGFDRSALPPRLDELEKSVHVGIFNVYRRLKLKYGEKASVIIESERGKGTTVTMVLPAVHRNEEDCGQSG